MAKDTAKKDAVTVEPVEPPVSLLDKVGPTLDAMVRSESHKQRAELAAIIVSLLS